MKRHCTIFVASILAAIATRTASAGSLRVIIQQNAPSAGGTTTLRFVSCTSGCGGATIASVTVPCAQLDPDTLATTIVCAIKSDLPATYSARITGQGQFDLFFPSGQCVCVDGDSLGPSDNASACSANYEMLVDGTVPQLIDCNGNDVADATDISTATSTDCNSNGIPDACDVGWEPKFESHDKYPTGDFPVALAGNDFDLDGRTDVGAAVDLSEHHAAVLRNLSAGTQGSLVALSAPTQYVVAETLSLPSVTSARLIGNGDSKFDLALARQNENAVAMFKNTSSGPGNIQFQRVGDVGFNLSVGFVLAADLDGDGIADLAGCSVDGRSVFAKRNLGNDNFDAIPAEREVDTGPNFVAAGDLDGDGRLDLVTSNSQSFSVSVVRNTTAAPGQSITLAARQDISTGSVVPQSVTVADFDCDGRNDIAFCGFFGADNKVGILRNVSYSGGVFTMTLTTFDTGSFPYCIASADFNNDGYADLVTANENDRTASVFINHRQGNMQFSRGDYYAGEGPYYVITPDLDRDGDADIAIANKKAFTLTEGYVYVILNRMAANYAADCDANGLPDGCACTGVEPGDVNSDGRIDGRDVQPFANQLFGGVTPTCPADVNRSGSLTVADAPTLVCKLLGRPNCCHGCGPVFAGSLFSEPIADCNTNGIADAEDIASQASEDCNSNGAPDECESLDCNTNNILDDCETAGGQNDCNGNFLPDECDLLYGPSFDCNTNGVPDECDLLGETSFDCNENLVPDECDIADATSEDSNSNGVPDECEEQQGRSMMAGEGDHSESATGQTPVPPDGSTPVPADGSTTGRADPSAAGQSSESSNPYAALPVKWQALMAWLDATDFSAMSPDEIDAALAAKMVELGLVGG
ncbi:MAG: FG-GAP-like repeat-containing protein [Phycisphaerae bacterium]